MPDLLAHAFIAYSIALLLSWRYDWISPAYATVAMAGAFIPDLTKIKLVISSGTVEQLLGIPFDWNALHTVGGATIAILIGVTVVAPREQRRTFALLSVGALSHLFADGLLQNPSGHSYAMLWPLTQYHPPTPGLYLSTQAEPMIVAAIAAVVIHNLTKGRLQR
ncbi:metal-dependent hydrolase [Haladaptatus sp. DFWS20]|uniref:metal-dependent hydrolase n=1 Tax=Haladaptatus sp. DFWS20 TaxID=3403467 RepID=UPI003EBAE8EF